MPEDVELRRMLLKIEQCETETLNSTVTTEKYSAEATTTRKSFFRGMLVVLEKALVDRLDCGTPMEMKVLVGNGNMLRG